MLSCYRSRRIPQAASPWLVPQMERGRPVFRGDSPSALRVPPAGAALFGIVGASPFRPAPSPPGIYISVFLTPSPDPPVRQSETLRGFSAPLLALSPPSLQDCFSPRGRSSGLRPLLLHLLFVTLYQIRAIGLVYVLRPVPPVPHRNYQRRLGRSRHCRSNAGPRQGDLSAFR